MARRYLGYGYTNSQGIAKLEYDADGEPLTHSYTGVGAGKLDIVAESGSLQSESYAIYDCIVFDNGISSDYNDIWTASNADLTRTSTYSRLSETTVGTNAIIYANFPNVNIIEFDILQEDGEKSDALFGFYQGSSALTTLQLRHLEEEVELNTWYKVKCVIGENEVTIINMDTEFETVRTFEGTVNRGRFVTSGTMTALRFRNFKAY